MTTLSRNVTLLFGENELELRETELKLIFGWAKELELELIFQPNRNWNILKGIDPITACRVKFCQNSAFWRTDFREKNHIRGK